MHRWPAEQHDPSPDPDCRHSDNERHALAFRSCNGQRLLEATHLPYGAASPSHKLLQRFGEPSPPTTVHPGRAIHNNDLLRNTARFIASRDHSGVHMRIEEVDLRPLWRVPPQPPVTVESLSVLDLDRLSTYAKLYHDCHLEPEIILQPNPKPRAEEYWAVSAFEFALYIQHNDDSTPHSWLHSLTNNPRNALPLRLECVFQTLRDVLKTIVPREDVEEIESRIDPQLLTKQVSKGCCDFITFAECLQRILKRSCAPERSASIDHFVKHMRNAVGENDPCLYAFAFEYLFNVLEGMKIDMCHSFIRQNRLKLVADSVLCEQRYFISHIYTDWEPSTTFAWYKDRIFSGPNPLQELAFVLLDSISEGSTRLPQTFMFDWQRLDMLRAVFRFFCAETAVTKTIEWLLRRMGVEDTGETGDIDTGLLISAKNRVRDVDPTLSFWCSSPSSSSSTSESVFAIVALEIARATSCIGRKASVPPHDAVSNAEHVLLQFMGHEDSRTTFQYDKVVQSIQSMSQQSDQTKKLQTPSTDIRAEVRSHLRNLVSSELARMRNMPATEICAKHVLASHQQASPTLATVQLQTGLDLGIARSRVQPAIVVDELLLFAQRIAHIAITHWRVWQPILQSVAHNSNS